MLLFIYCCCSGLCRSVVFYNSLAHNRTSVVRVHVNVANVEVQDPNGKVIESQVDPFFVDNEVSTNIFKVCRCVCEQLLSACILMWRGITPLSIITQCREN